MNKATIATATAAGASAHWLTDSGTGSSFGRGERAVVDRENERHDGEIHSDSENAIDDHSAPLTVFSRRLTGQFQP